MNQQQNTIKDLSIKYGITSGTIGVIFSLILFFTDSLYDKNSSTEWVSWLVEAAIIILAIIAFKKANDGLLSLSESIKIGLGVMVISGLISCLYMFLLANFMEPEYFEKTLEVSRELILEQNPTITMEQLDQMAEIQKSFSWVVYPSIIIGSLILGLLVSLTAGLFLKKSNPEH